MTETLANGYLFESTHQELSNEYQHDRVLMILKIICIPMLWTKVPSALEGLKSIVLCNFFLTLTSLEAWIWPRDCFIPLPTCQMIASGGWFLKGHSLASSSYHTVLENRTKSLVQNTTISHPRARWSPQEAGFWRAIHWWMASNSYHTVLENKTKYLVQNTTISHPRARWSPREAGSWRAIHWPVTHTTQYWKTEQNLWFRTQQYPGSWRAIHWPVTHTTQYWKTEQNLWFRTQIYPGSWRAIHWPVTHTTQYWKTKQNIWFRTQQYPTPGPDDRLGRLVLEGPFTGQ